MLLPTPIAAPPPPEQVREQAEPEQQEQAARNSAHGWCSCGRIIEQQQLSQKSQERGAGEAPAGA